MPRSKRRRRVPSSDGMGSSGGDVEPVSVGRRFVPCRNRSSIGPSHRNPKRRETERFSPGRRKGMKGTTTERKGRSRRGSSVEGGSRRNWRVGQDMAQATSGASHEEGRAFQACHRF
eukprot:scaffold136_cov325-Pavlova_lutheri.AAC.8